MAPGRRLELLGIMRIPVTGSTVLSRLGMAEVPGWRVDGVPDRALLPILDPGRAGTDAWPAPLEDVPGRIRDVPGREEPGLAEGVTDGAVDRSAPGRLPGRGLDTLGRLAERGLAVDPGRLTKRDACLPRPPTTGRLGFQTVFPGWARDPGLPVRRSEIVTPGCGGFHPAGRWPLGFQSAGRGGRPLGGHTETGRG